MHVTTESFMLKQQNQLNSECKLFIKATKQTKVIIQALMVNSNVMIEL